MKKHDQDFMKRQNRLTVFQIIKNEQPISRAAIAKQTGMSPTTVSRIVAELTDEGYVHETEEQVSAGRGRKSSLIRLLDTAVISIGVELDRDRANIGFVDIQGNVLCSESFSRPPNEEASTTVARIGSTIEDLIATGGIDRKRIVGIGVGLPGIIEVQEGIVKFSVQLGWKNIRLADLLQDATGFHAVVDNELKVKALAEQLKGSAYGSNRTVLLGFGNGVGSALILEGEIYRGVTNSAGEIGHTTVDPEGMMCDCGKAGCLQTYINIPSLLSEASKIKPVRTIEELFAERRAGTHWACYLIDRALAYMAITVNNVVSMYNPDSVILSGEILDKFPEVHEEIVNLCSRYVWEPLQGSFSIVRSKLHEEGVMIGSGMVAQDRYFQLN
ncbi:ROK family transcriptional regulator [Paenibacillus lactis]|uniref:ROK family protein n=1 Tax=Paenibacillus lactis 154 TaxID=743719 RepID=G4HAY9_9BACL|nr:ROK family transcriptional regulator [Paenibacillus lactis]EHB67098.1 ROK family protein [Paenibacillus lactis 154]